MAASGVTAGPPVRRKALANALRRLRQDAGLTLEDAATALGVSVPTISRYEKGIRTPRGPDVKELAGLYGANETATRELLALVTRAKESGWWESFSEAEDFGISAFISFEAAATRLLEFSHSVVPGLLQTKEYASAIYQGAVSPTLPTSMSSHDIEKMVEIRLHRQRRLGRGLTMSVVLDESVLQRQVGGPRVLREQLLKLAESSRSPAVSLRILPFSAGAHPGLKGEFQVLVISTEEVSDVVHLESHEGYTIVDQKDVVAQYMSSYEIIVNHAMSEEASTNWLDNIVTEL